MTTLKTHIERSEYLPQIIHFIEEIGLSVIEKDLPENTFLPGLELGAACIYVDYQKLKYAGDFLHEAGHLAVTTTKQRLAVGTHALELPWPTDGEEIATVLWSYAAVQYLRLPLDVVFHAGGYKNDSDWLISHFESGQFIGLVLLQWMGLAYDEQQIKTQGMPAFPVMQRWLRE